MAAAKTPHVSEPKFHSGITNEELAHVICCYFADHAVGKDKYLTLHKYTEIAENTLKCWYPTCPKRVYSSSVDKLYNGVSKYFNIESHRREKASFIEDLCLLLKHDGYNSEVCHLILSQPYPLSQNFYSLIQGYTDYSNHLLSYLPVSSIISHVQALSDANKGFFSVVEQTLKTPAVDGYDNHFLISNDADRNSDRSLNRNYLILSFPLKYRVLIVLSNELTQYNENVRDYLTELKKNNMLNMILVFTDNEISQNHQIMLLEHFNLFFERVNENDFSKVSLTDVRIQDYDQNSENTKSWFYTQVIMNRLITYFSIIRSEVVYEEFKRKKESGKLASPADTDIKDLTVFANRILMQQIYHYSPITCQSINYERNLIKEAAEQLMTKRHSDKLDLVIELCAPNAILSAPVQPFCEKLMLFSSSHNAITYYKELQKTENLKNLSQNNSVNQPTGHDQNTPKKTGIPEASAFPSNIEFHQTHPSTEYITQNYMTVQPGRPEHYTYSPERKTTIGSENSHNPVPDRKADMVILGVGMASSIASLREHMRSINMWLKNDGIVILSFINEASVMFQKQNSNLHSYERKPLIYSNLWQYEFDGRKKFMIRTNLENTRLVRSILDDYMDETEFYSYPYLLSLAPDHLNTRDMQEIRLMDRQHSMTEHEAYKKIVDEYKKKMNNKGVNPKDIFSANRMYAIPKGKFYGHYLYAIGHKNGNNNRQEENSANVFYYLRKILPDSYRIHTHKFAENSIQLQQALQDTGMDSEKYALLKVLILSRASVNEVVYCILPAQNPANYEGTNYRPITERRINNKIGYGIVSPMVAISQIGPDLTFNGQFTKRIICIDIDSLPQPYVIMPSGNNREAFSITKEQFKLIFQKEEAIFVRGEELKEELMAHKK